MIKVATAINSFASQAMQTDSAPPSEETVFILRSSWIQATIKEAIQPLRDRIESLESTIAHQDEKIATLESTLAIHADNQLIQLRIINVLREVTKKGPQPMQKDRADILRALLAANSGKMLAQDARKKMHLSKQLFSMLVASMGDHIETKPLRADNRKKVLILK